MNGTSLGKRFQLSGALIRRMANEGLLPGEFVSGRWEFGEKAVEVLSKLTKYRRDPVRETVKAPR